MRWGLVVSALAIATGCGLGGDPAGPGQLAALLGTPLSEAEVDTVLVRANSPLREPARDLIRTRAEWVALWDRIHRTVSPSPSAPEIDLDGHVLVLAAMGTRPTGGYSIAVDGVARDGDDLVVLVEERSPSASCMVTQAVTAPVTVVRLPEPAGTIRFVEAAVTVSC